MWYFGIIFASLLKQYALLKGKKYVTIKENHVKKCS